MGGVSQGKHYCCIGTRDITRYGAHSIHCKGKHEYDIEADELRGVVTIHGIISIQFSLSNTAAKQFFGYSGIIVVKNEHAKKRRKIPYDRFCCMLSHSLPILYTSLYNWP
jgi:hypothetical protein